MRESHRSPRERRHEQPGVTKGTTSPDRGPMGSTPTTAKGWRSADSSTKESVGRTRRRGSARADARTSATSAWAHTRARSARAKTDPRALVALMAARKPPTSEDRQRRRSLQRQARAQRGAKLRPCCPPWLAVALQLPHRRHRLHRSHRRRQRQREWAKATATATGHTARLRRRQSLQWR